MRQIAHFLGTLDPSDAVAVADYRAEQRHDETQASLAELKAMLAGADLVPRLTLEERLSAIPPLARTELLIAFQQAPDDAEKLLGFLTSARLSHRAEDLRDAPPGWLALAHGSVLATAAHVVHAFGHRQATRTFWTGAAEAGYDPARTFAMAALEAAGQDDNEGAAALLERASQAGGGTFVDVIRHGAASEWPQMLASVDRATALTDPTLARLYAAALWGDRGMDASIAFLEEAADAHPDNSTLRYLLGGQLLERSRKGGTTSRAHDREGAMRHALRSRDLRRAWAGAAPDATALAVNAAILNEDYERVIELGTEPPRGEARPEEAAHSQVAQAVGQAALVVGDDALVAATSALAAGFEAALLTADRLQVSQAPRDEVEAAFRRVWALAVTDLDKAGYWLSASHAGIDPLEGAAELDERDDDLPAIVRSQLDVAAGNITGAIARLQAVRDSEACRRLLVSAYLLDGRVDDAVVELVDTADRFDNPEHLERAAHILAAKGRTAEAAEHAARVLRETAVPASRRRTLHEIGVAAAHNVGDWRLMERLVRAWIRDLGPAPRVRWLLIQAVFNQGDHDGAWRLLQEAGDLLIDCPLEAQLWMELTSRYSPSTESTARMLELAEVMQDQPGVVRVATNCYLTTGDDKGEVSESDRARWQQLLDRRRDEPEPDDTFMVLTIPEDPTPEQLADLFRPMLEDQARRVDQVLDQVRNGYPVGMLSMVLRRSYTEALTHRAGGMHFLRSPDSNTRAQEVADAAAALNGAVVADLSTIAVGWYYRDLWPKLTASFSRVEVVGSSLRDAAAARARLQVRSTTTMKWDLDADQPRLHETDEETLDRLERTPSGCTTRPSSSRIAKLPATTTTSATRGCSSSSTQSRTGWGCGLTTWACGRWRGTKELGPSARMRSCRLCTTRVS